MIMKKHIIFGLLGVFFVLAICGAASANNLTVGPGHTYKNITSALSHASPGDTIKVYDNYGKAYTYKENVLINKKNLTISSYGNVTVQALNGYKPVFTANGNYTTIKGFKITGANRYNGDISYDLIPANFTAYGILVTGYSCVISANKIINNLVGVKAGSYTTLLNNLITSNTTTKWTNWYGVFLGNHNLIQNNNITNTSNSAIVDSKAANLGIGINKLGYYGYNKITGNRIVSTYDAMTLYKISHDIITNNTITIPRGKLISPPQQMLDTGIFMIGSTYNQIYNNNIQHAYYAGIYAGEQSDHNIIHDNILRYNGYNTGGNGIKVRGSSYTQIFNNTIDHGGAGVSLDAENTPYIGNYNNIYGNNLTNNEWGMDITDSFNDTVTSNNILNNNYGIFNEGGSQGIVLRFNRIVGNNNTIYNNFESTMDARYNWWGSNQDPSTMSGITNYGVLDLTPWIVLKINANPTLIKIFSSSKISAYLTYDSNGVYHNPTSGHIPDGVPVTFTTTLGTITNLVSLVNGTATATESSGIISGIANIIVSVDNQILKTSVTIYTIAPPFNPLINKVLGVL
jgi:parallel beta-helix repeat protein